jgi:hypothetical protein
MIYNRIRRILNYICFGNFYTINTISISQELQNIGCFTLEDIAILIINGFNNYDCHNVKIAIEHFRNYLSIYSTSKFHNKIVISLPHKNDPWQSLNLDNTYLVGADILGNFCNYRWLIQINQNTVNFIQKFDVNKYIHPKLLYIKPNTRDLESQEWEEEYNEEYNTLLGNK